MKKSRLGFAAVAATLVLALTGCGGQQPAASGSSQTSAGATNQDVVKIGFLGALTGDTAGYGTEELKGMQLAVDQLNGKGGILGKQVKLLQADNRGDKVEAVNIVQKYVTQDKVNAIVGDPTTGITKAAAPIAQKNKVVLMSMGAVGAGVVEIGDYIFRDVLTDSIAVPAVAKFVVEDSKWTKIGIITSMNNDYSVGQTTLWDKSLAGLKANVVAREKIQDGNTDFSSQVTKLKAAGVDGIVFTGYYTEGALFMQEVRKQGMTAVMIGGDGLLSSTLMELGGKAVEGSMLFTGFSAETTVESSRKFIDAYKATNNGQIVDEAGSQAYDAVMMIAQAMEKAKSTDPSVFKTELAKTTNYEGVSGTITFLPSREPVKSPVFVQAVQNGKLHLLKAVQVSASGQ